NATSGGAGAASSVLTGLMGMGGWGDGLGGAIAVGATTGMPVGTVVYNDSGSATNHFENQMTVDLSFASGSPTGSVVSQGTNHRIGSSLVDHKTDRDDDSL